MKRVLLVSTVLAGALAFSTAASAHSYNHSSTTSQERSYNNNYDRSDRAADAMMNNNTVGYSSAAVNNDTTGSVDTNLHRNFQVHDSALGDSLSSGGATGTTGGSAKGNVRHMTVGSQGNSLITVGAADAYRDNYGYRAQRAGYQQQTTTTTYTTGAYNPGNPYGYSGNATGTTGGSTKNNVRDYSVGADGNTVTRSTSDTMYNNTNAYPTR
jgi:hypothetical protein